MAELFLSINGEGPKAGGLAAFIRLKGCNLHCSWCDTRWACGEEAPYEEMTAEELAERVLKTGAVNVTVTGGEPLLQPGIGELLHVLAQAGLSVEVETNGSVLIEPFTGISDRIFFTMDYKLPGSGMEQDMRCENFSFLTEKDSVKFVIADEQDFRCALERTEEYLKESCCQVFLSPVFGKISPRELVELMKEERFVRGRLQLQLHKFIWEPDRRGV